MNKKQINTHYKELIDNRKINYDLLIQAYALLDKQVSKYAYLKKKWENGGMSNLCYTEYFNQSIQKRNAVERLLKSEYSLSVDNIKSKARNVDVMITIRNCDSLVELVKSESYEFIAE